MTQNPVSELTSQPKEWPPQQYDVEAGAIKRFVRAVGDAKPNWEKVAPPTFATILGFDKVIEQTLDVGSFDTLLHGKTELECFLPILPKDTITVSTKIADQRQRKSKTGSVTFINFETSYTNQRNELVAKCQQLVIGYQGVVNMVTEICNRFLDLVDDGSDDRHFEMMR